MIQKDNQRTLADQLFHPEKQNTKTALILAAGIGKRLQPITNTIPKCLIEIEEKPLLNRNIELLIEHGFEKIIIVTGYKSELIESEIKRYTDQINIITVWNPEYQSTNNIYSLWLAKTMIDEPFVLLESDLYLESSVFSYFKQPDLIALDLFDPEIHSGTTGTTDSNGILKRLNTCNKEYISESEVLYKTVNIYSFSLKTWSLIRERIHFYIQQNDLNLFYEVAIADLVRKGSISLKMVDFSSLFWHEIDTCEDLSRVRNIVQDLQLNVSIQ